MTKCFSFYCEECNKYSIYNEEAAEDKWKCDVCHKQLSSDDMKYILHSYYDKTDYFDLEGNQVTPDVMKPKRTTPIIDKSINVACPYCKSNNCSKIGTIKRSISFGLFGFGSGKIGKQWHCNDCKSDF